MNIFDESVINVYQTKGGVGASTIATAIALLSDKNTLLVDHGRDIDGILGLGGFQDSQQFNDNLLLVDAATYHKTPDIRSDFELIVHDCGLGRPGNGGLNVLVTNGCYLALRNFVRWNVKADVLVFVDQPGRALTMYDASRVVEPTRVISVPFSPQIARSVDAGLFGVKVSDELRKAFTRHLEVAH